MRKNTEIIGKARTVLVFGSDNTAKAVVSSIVVRRRRYLARKRVLMRGLAVFEQVVFDHLVQDVLGVVDRISELLGVKRQSFEIEVVTPGAVSMSELGVTVTGFSADVPVLLALLSAATKMGLPQDLVTTGHVASGDGELRPVRHIPVKLAAAIAEPNVHKFLCPSLTADGSVAALAPEENAKAEEAIAAAKDQLKVGCVSDVQQLLEQVFDDNSLLLAALRSDFFGTEQLACVSAGPLERAVGFLAANHDKRFWHALEIAFTSGDVDKARTLLLERLRFHLRHKTYPHGLGSNLLPLVRSIPVTVRRRTSAFPVIPLRECFRLAQFAGPDDHADVQALLDAISGKRLRGRAGQEVDAATVVSNGNATQAVEAVLADISAESLSEKIGQPIDLARASYALQDVVVDSHEAFFDQVEAFYLAMLRQTAGGVITASDMLAAEANDLLSRAFAGKGNTEGALAEAQYGTNGGMRYILDVMTEQFKAEQQAKRVNQVLKTAVDALDWSARVAFIAAFLKRIGPQLPAEVRCQPPERFARHYETIFQEYAKSMNQVNRVLQRF